MFRGVRDLRRFDDPDEAVARLAEIYRSGRGRALDALSRLERDEPAPEALEPPEAFYPYLGLAVEPHQLDMDARHAFGVALDAGLYGTTVTRPDLFGPYLREQLGLLVRRHGAPACVGISDAPMPLPFLAETRMAALSPAAAEAAQRLFAMPNLRRMDDRVANGTRMPRPGEPRPLALFDAERTDYSLARLKHYTGTDPASVQSFILLTNYQRYVDGFLDWARRMLGRDGYETLVEPGVTTNPGGREAGTRSGAAPQMPAYHLTRADGQGMTLVNIGVGPSNAKTITDHLAVLRPHCWLMIGHCAGLRRSQRLGDYVLAHGYVRDDRVLDDDLPLWVPVPPIAEVQQALIEATARVTGLRGMELKTRVRTGAVVSTADRNWELAFEARAPALNQARAIALDMESATIAANGYRFRTPYGVLLCVSDKPVHGEIKLGGQAEAFYRERVSQHLDIGLETLRLLREEGADRLHSRKLRSFDEPPFR
jgi:AMP nucleosidase